MLENGRRLARDHPVAVFVLVTFTWTWTIDFALRATNHSRLLSVLIVGIYGPSVGALVTSALGGGWQAVGRLMRRLLPWRVSVLWCLIAFAVPAVIDVAAIAIYAGRGDAIGRFVAPSALATIAYCGIKFTRGPLGEELGWRGFALPTLQTRYGALTSSLIIGVLWFAWHLPMIYWTAGTYISGPSVTAGQLGWFAIAILSLSVLETWVVNRAGGNIVPAVLMHGGGNIGLALLFLPELSGDAILSIVYLSAIPSVILAIAVSAIPRTVLDHFFHRSALSRERLP